MYSVELYSRVRRACHVDGMSKSAAARHFGIDRKTVSKILKHAVPPGYRRNGPPARPKLDPFIPLINQILEEDKSRLKKQRHTSKRIYERLRDEHGFVGGITIVTDYVRERKRRTREVFVPLSHAPGHAQVDFGEALGEIGGVVSVLLCMTDLAHASKLKEHDDNDDFQGTTGRAASGVERPEFALMKELPDGTNWADRASGLSW